MDIQWFSKSPKGVATIYESNITLNTVATNHFKNAFGILIGYSTERKTLLIKSVSKDEIVMGLYKDLEIHEISVKPSYGRITGKSMISKLCEFYPIEFNQNSLNKYECEWNSEEKTLEIFLERRIN